MRPIDIPVIIQLFSTGPTMIPTRAIKKNGNKIYKSFILLSKKFVFSI